MKKVFIIFLFAYHLASAQDALQPRRINATAVAMVMPMTTKWQLDIDSGQVRKATTDCRVRGEDGKVLRFQSLAQVMNYLTDHGWVIDSEEDNYATHSSYSYRLHKQAAITRKP